jgi:beta-lactamase regulating signal transducer with metallopeptidase domain/predicted hotdog family 3-hydroxylacyl-ACP dehydratase
MPPFAAWITDRLPDLLASPLAARLGWTCLHSLWQGLAIAALLAIALRLIPRRSSAATNARYLLATAALVALPVAAVATFAIVEPGVNPAAAEAASDAASATASRFARDGAARPASVPQSPTIVLLPHLATAAARPAARASFATAAASAALDQLRPWLPAIAGVWLAGALLAAGRMTCGYWLTRRIVARGEALADGRFQASVERWRRALGIDAAVRVLASAAVEAPVVVGWLKPVILWPAAAIVGLPAHELDALVVHELAHVRRQDALMNLLQACIDVLFFHHPAAWWISGQVRAEREHCADDLAVRVLEAGHAGSRLSYAKALLALEERRQAHALALAANGGSLLDRIRRLAGVEEQPASPVRPLAAAVMASLLVAVLVTAAAPIREARADELPKDTNKIESLTVEQAKKLVEEFPGVTVVVKRDTSEERLNGSLPLNRLSKLGPDVAEVLARYSKGPLFLDGLTTLSDEVSTALAQYKGNRLFLDGLTTLSDESAKALAQHKGHLLSLNGLASLSGEVAKALAEYSGFLDLNGLPSLSVEAAKALAQHKGKRLQLKGLTAISDDAAKAIAQHKGNLLALNGLASLSEEAAKAFAAHAGDLYLYGLTTLSDEAATALAQHEGKVLSLNGLTTLSDVAAKALAQHRGYGLGLDVLPTLSVEAAKALGQHKGEMLSLGGLTTLSADAAAALAQYKGEVLYLGGLTTLSVDAAAALAQHRGNDMYLSVQPTLSAEVAKALSQHKGHLYIYGLPTLSVEAANALAEHKGHMLALDGLTTLSDEAAKALAQHKGDWLSLNGLTTLSDEAATALAQHEGKVLSLNGLTTLSDVAAKALAQRKGELSLRSISFSLTADSALVWATLLRGRLAAVTALDSPDSVAIAKALATRKGPLSLPNLKKLPPKTLSALIEKEDIEIPLIETLELIPEPDGSPTEDFVIPEGFQQRQNQQRQKR